ncbi:MAG: nucleoside-diphosphate sugar epimerase/dehydratase [Acidobacteriota bacterium]
MEKTAEKILELLPNSTSISTLATYWKRIFFDHNSAARYRRSLIITAYILTYFLAYLAAFSARFEFPIFLDTLVFPFLATVGVVLIVKLLVGYLYSIYQAWWRYISLGDMISLTCSATTAGIILFILRSSFPETILIPYGVIVIDWAFTIISLAVMRASIYLFNGYCQRRRLVSRTPEATNRILIVGAGDAGEALLRDIQSHPQLGLKVIGFLDDDDAKWGRMIRRVPVLGSVADAPRLVQQFGVTQALIAIPSATGKQLRRLIKLLEPTSVPFKTVPTLDQLVSGQVKVSQIREIRIEDLLRRQPIQTDLEKIHQLVKDRVLMVTGAGGSIGSELCRQIIKLQPTQLILLERAENNLFSVEQELLRTIPDASARIIPMVGDINDIVRMQEIFTTYKPDVIFHAAAHKHVPMMEANPAEAVKNNIIGTKRLVDLAHQYGIYAFIMISTDKAVNPTSVMGASKRAAEIYVQAMNAVSQTKFITVRFGNVLGSSGSVIPTFQEQIRRGGPVTVTHPEMRRFFMTIPEAVQLVLQSFALGGGGEIFTLDMGELIKIDDMARDLIHLSGFKPDEDIEIIYTGIRPGEKLYEELQLDGEDSIPTSHRKIKIALSRKSDLKSISRKLAEMPLAIDSCSRDQIKRWLATVVSEYKVDEIQLKQPMKYEKLHIA